MPASEYQGAEVKAGAPLLIKRADRAPLGALLLVIAILWLACAISAFMDGRPAIVPGLGTFGAHLAGTLGTALAVIALDWLVRGRTVVVGRGTVAVTTRSLLRRRTWREPLANYREIRAYHEQRPHRYGARSWYVVRLWHPEPGKMIELARAKDPALIERRARDYAARCGLPLSWLPDEANSSAAHRAARRIETAAAAGRPVSAH